MDRLSVIMVKSSLCWLLTGFLIGGLMLVDRAIPGQWRLWMLPTHGHMLFVGWFLQFALGIAYWLLPRKRSPQRPVGYDERLGMLAAFMLNAGLLLRVVSEPFERPGHANALTLTGLSASAVLQVVAAILFVSQMWPRIIVKERLGKPKAV